MINRYVSNVDDEDLLKEYLERYYCVILKINDEVRLLMKERSTGYDAWIQNNSDFSIRYLVASNGDFRSFYRLIQEELETRENYYEDEE